MSFVLIDSGHGPRQPFEFCPGVGVGYFEGAAFVFESKRFRLRAARLHRYRQQKNSSTGRTRCVSKVVVLLGRLTSNWFIP